MNFPDRAAARAMCLGSHAAHGDYGGCDSAAAAQLCSHAARGGRGSRSSARTLHVVAVARLARCAPSAVGALTPRNQLYIVPHPKYYLLNGCRNICRRGKKNDIYAALIFRSTVSNNRHSLKILIICITSTNVYTPTPLLLLLLPYYLL